MASLCGSISLTLAVCLVFLVPFSVGRNVDLQGLLLIVSGAFAWVAILFGHRRLPGSLDRLSLLLLGVFMLSCLASCLVTPHAGYNFFGAPYIRLGFGGLLACIGIGLLARTVPRQRLLTGLYLLVAGLAVTAIPYSLIHTHSLLRVGGVTNQADIFACFLGVGLIFGLELFRLYPERQRALMVVQIFLTAMLVLTQTRAVLLLVVIIWLIWMFQHRRGISWRRIAMYLAAALVLLTALHYAIPGRLTDTGYASQSFHYRLTLQRYAWQASQQKPLLGYGLGNLADPLSCERLTTQSLQKTCNEGYFFNSSHNIFIDRALAIGWLGGLAFLGLIGLAIYRGFGAKKETAVFSCGLLLIGCYYLTNVTSAVLELLLWVLIMQCLAAPTKTKPHHA